MTGESLIKAIVERALRRVAEQAAAQRAVEQATWTYVVDPMAARTCNVWMEGM